MLRYAEQPLAERAFIAEQAQRVEVRRSGGPVTLAEAADIVLSADGRSVQDLDFDSRRRADGRWIVTAAPRDAGPTAAWVYDHAGRSLQPMDDAARRLMGVEPTPRPAAEPVPTTQPPVEPERPRLTAVPSVVEEPEPVIESGHESVEPVAPVAAASPSRTADQPTVVIAVDASPSVPAGPPVESTEEVEPTAPAERGGRKRATRPKGRRSSVPSWDEILFGSPSHDAD